MKIPHFLKEIWYEVIELKLLIPAFLFAVALALLVFCLFHPYFKEIHG